MSAREHRPNKLNSQQVKEIRKRIQQPGTTQVDLAREYGVTHQTIAYQVRDVKRRYVCKPIAQQVDEAEVVLLYGIHCNVTTVARHLGVPHKTITRTLARLEA